MEAAVSAIQQDGIEIHICDASCLEFVFDSLRYALQASEGAELALAQVYRAAEAHGLSESEVRVLHILALPIK